MGFQRTNRSCRVIALGFALMVGGGVLLGGGMSLPWSVPPAQAYSYAAAGKEPLIDAREAALAAIAKGNWPAAQAAMDQAKDEVTYLVEHHFPNLREEITQALKNKDEVSFRLAMRDAFVAEIERRLDGAHQNLHDYQSAKVLVIKARRFLDAIGPDLNPRVRGEAEKALSDALQAVGNPGVFGVGARKADPTAFAKAEQHVREILRK